MKKKFRKKINQELNAFRDNLSRLSQSLPKSRMVDKGVRAMLNTISLSIAIISPKMRIIWINRHLQEAYPSINTKQKPICYKAFFRPPKNKICAFCPVLNALRTGKVHSSETGIRSNGKVYNITATPVKDKDERIIYVMETLEDITMRKQTEKKLESLHQQLLRSNRRLRNLTLRDSYTGLYNHHYFEDIIDAEFFSAKKLNKALSLIMLDIDYFRSINEVYGHKFGDLVLKQLSRLLKKMVRKYDSVIRFGGEEFLIISSGTDRAKASILAQRLLDAVSIYNFGDKNRTVKLKLSISVVSFPEDKAVNPAALVDLAERTVNLAKEQGGGRVLSSAKIKAMRKNKTRADVDIKLLRRRIAKLTTSKNQSLVEAVLAFARAIQLRDHYTGEHVAKMAFYSTALAKALNLSEAEVELIREASILHDLGKVGISDQILLNTLGLCT